MRIEPATLTMKELDVQYNYFKTISKDEKKEYKRLDDKKQREILAEFNGEPIEYYGNVTEIIAQNEYLETLSRAEKKKYKKLSTFEQHEIIEEYMNGPAPVIHPEPAIYDFDTIKSKLREVSLYGEDGLVKPLTDERLRLDNLERYADLSPGEERYLKAQQRINSITAELTEILTEMQRKHPNYKVATNYQEVEPNYHNQKYFDAIEQLTEGLDWDSLTPYEQKELEAESAPYEYEILANQPTSKAKASRATQKKAKDSKLVEYVKSVEESLNSGVINKDYAKQAIINYLDKEL